MRTIDCAALLRENDGFLILTHKKPDGDAVGSAAALCHGLRRLGKTAYLYKNPEIVDAHQEFTAPYYAPPEFAAAYIISVDTASEEMFPVGFAGAVDLAVDHNGSNTMYAKNTLLFPELSSCGEVVFELLSELRLDVDATEATLLYIAVSTDTGCFCYSNTTPNTLRTAARLIECGADNGALNKKLFRAVSKARIALEGMIYSAIELYMDGRVAVAPLTLQMVERSGAVEDDLDDIAGLAGRIAGVSVSATLREVIGGKTKVSLRTSGDVDANAVCALFGGGGHLKAAGCRVDAGVEGTAQLLLDAMRPYMK